MNFLWGAQEPSPEVVVPSQEQQKAEQAFSSPTSLASRRSRTVSPGGSVSRSLRSLKHVTSHHRFSKPADPVMDVILDSPTILPSTNTTKKPVNETLCSPVNLACGSAKVVEPENSTTSRSMSPPAVKKRIGIPFRRHAKDNVPVEEHDAGKNKVPQDDLTDAAQSAMLNADSVIAKAADSFKKTFDFISGTMETNNTDAVPVSPSTVSTRSETPPLSPASPASRSNPVKKILAPFKRPATSNDEEDFDPILEARSVLSSSPIPELRLSPSSDSTLSSRRSRLSLTRRALANWKGRSKDATKTPEQPATDEPNAVAASDCAAASRELALLKLQESLSNLGNAFTTVAFGPSANSSSNNNSNSNNRDIPSLINDSSTALTLEESFDPASLANEAIATNGGVKIEAHEGQAVNAVGQTESPNSGNMIISTDRSIIGDRDLAVLRLHDSLSVLPSHAIDTAWMSYCDLPSLLQSQSSTNSFDGAPDATARAAAVSPVGRPNEKYSTQSDQDGTDYVLIARVQSSDYEHFDSNFPEEQVLTHEETLAQMHASLGGLISTVFGNDSSHIDKALDEAKAEGKTKPICPSPQLEGRKRRALEPEEQTHFVTGDQKRIGLEPEEQADFGLYEEQTDFGVDELVMKVENEEITCLTEETYEVVSETKYYPVEVASSGLGIPRCAQATASEYVAFSDELVERHIQANFYLEDPLSDIPLDTLEELRDSPSEREHRERWAALSYHSSRESEKEETQAYSPSIEVTRDLASNPTVIVKGEDPPGKGPWPGICMDPCLSEGADMSLASSNFIFCHQSPKELTDSLSASLLEIGSKVQQLDDEHLVSQHVSKSVSDLGSTLTSIWKQTDKALGVSVATKQVSTVIKETAKNPPKPEDFQRRLREIDEEHRIIEQTASAVAEGAQYLAQSLESMAGNTHRPGTLITA